MAQSRAFTFTDPDAFQQRVRASTSTILSLGRGDYRAELTQVDFDRLWLQCGVDNLPRISRAAMTAERAIINFISSPEYSPLRVAGRELTTDRIAVFGKGETKLFHTETKQAWSGMSLRHADLAAAGDAIAGREVVCPPDTYYFQPAPEHLARLRALHATAVRLARTSPASLADPALARALEHDLIHAMVTALTAGDAPRRRWLPGRHGKIANRFLEFLETRPHEPVYIAEICAAIGASERTLRTCCQEVMGVGPVRYLWLRRMHLARQALLHGDPAAASVTEIATTYGFWELGRFSVEYRALFGESPSATLRRPVPASARIIEFRPVTSASA
jgi:AraC-like DNA-binding protein